MTLRPLLFAFGFLYATSLPTTALAQYKWKGADGVIMYSDRPPEVGLNVTMLARPMGGYVAPVAAPQAGPGGAAPAAKSSSVGSASDKALAEKLAQASAADKAKDDAKKKEEERQTKRQCELMKESLAALDSGQRIARISASGEREMLSDDERSKRTREVKSDLAQHCK